MKLFRICSLSLLLVFFSCLLTMASSGPTEALKPTLQGMVDVLADPSFEGVEQKVSRREKIMGIVGQGFDFSTMSKMVLGQTWKKIDHQQREHFEQLFTKLLENAYIGKLEDYSGQKNILYKDERIKGKKAAVSTVVESTGTPPLPVNYVMIEAVKGWQVYDINIEGVSLVRNYREQFKSILRKKKFDGLIKVLEEKNASFNEEDIK